MMELSLKHVDDKDLKCFVQLLSIAKINDDKLRLCLVYILERPSQKEKDSVKQIIQETIEKTRGEKMISIADSYRMEGKAEGKA